MSASGLDPDDVTAAARAATGRDDGVVRWAATPVAIGSDNMTTAGLDRVDGTLADGTGFAMFVKTLRPASDAPIFQYIPEAARAGILVELDWLDEPRAYRSPLWAGLPDGLRMPSLWHVVESDDRVQLWLEAIEHPAVADLDGYRRAATALGRLSGRWPAGRVTAELGLPRRGLQFLWSGKTMQADLPVLAADGPWANPALMDDRDLRTDLDRVIAIVPTLLARMEALPEALTHGDACPANLLCGPDDLVAIDWSYASIGAIGSDLAQLLAGCFVEGRAEPSAVDDVTKAIVDPFTAGLAAEGAEVDDDAIELAFVTHLLLRAVFDALATVRSCGAEAAASRVALARFAVDRALALV